MLGLGKFDVLDFRLDALRIASGCVGVNFQERDRKNDGGETGQIMERVARAHLRPCW